MNLIIYVLEKESHPWDNKKNDQCMVKSKLTSTKGWDKLVASYDNKTLNYKESRFMEGKSMEFQRRENNLQVPFYRVWLKIEGKGEVDH